MAGLRPVPHRGEIPPRRRPARTQSFSIADPLVKLFVSGFLIAAFVSMAMFTYFYVKYGDIVDRRMSGPVFSNAAKIYARAQTVSVGEKLDAAEVAAELRRAGYAEERGNGDSPVGHYAYTPNGIQIIPGPESFHAAEGAVIHFESGKVSAIDETGGDSRNLEAYELEPQLVTALFEGERPLQARDHQVR